MTFSKEQLIDQAQKNIAVLRGAVERIPGASEAAVIHLRLAEITLAALTAEPVAWTTGRYSQNAGCKFYGEEKRPEDEAPGIMAVYWDKNTFADRAPSKEIADKWLAEAIEHTGAYPLYAALPAPVSVPETLPCPVMLEPGLRFGKGVRTQTMLDALQRRAEYSAELEAMTPEQRSDHDAGMKEFRTMLQSNCSIKPVADLFEVTVPSGRSTTFTVDAAEAKDCADMGWKVQEYVKLERYQDAMLQGAEPVQEWIPCSERMPEQFKAILVFNEYGEVWSGAYDRYWNFYCDNELVECVTHWMPLPAAPQQEVKK